MTTIILSASGRNGGKVQVFGNYQGPDDRYTFGVREFGTDREGRADAEAYARRMMEKHQADHFQRITR